MTTAFCNNLKVDDVVAVHLQRPVRVVRGKVVTQPRESSTSVYVLIDGLSAARYIPIQNLRLIVNGVAENVPPFDGELSASTPASPPITPITERPDSEKTEGVILDKVTRFEARSNPVTDPQHTRQNGEHMKHYLISYLEKSGAFHVEKVAAKGIVTAITMFYMQFNETAIVSVICVL